MGLLKFETLPVNTLVGADRATFDKVCNGVRIDPEFRGRFRTTKCIERILDPVYRINGRRWEKLPEIKMEAPVFILGHWRSGTTFFHNVLSGDSRYGYCTTYQTVFPHIMLWGYGFFRACTKVLMPSHRPTDSVELGPDLPQEEEFALVNMMPYSFYNFWFFPQLTGIYRERYLLFNGITDKEKETFKYNLDKLIRISLYRQGKSVYLSKNPPHTGRISTLLEMYPDAKFIYLVRNPYTVFESTRSFFRNILQSLQLQKISDRQLEEEIIVTYSELFDKYESEKGLIPEGNLVEVRFEDFEKDPLGMAQEIYGRLSVSGFENARSGMEKYVLGHKSFKKNRYNYSERTVRLVEQNWNKALEKWDYRL